METRGSDSKENRITIVLIWQDHYNSFPSTADDAEKSRKWLDIYLPLTENNE